MMRRASLLSLILVAWGVLVAAMAVLVKRVDDTERPVVLALAGGGDLDSVVGAHPSYARTRVEELWREGLRAGSEGMEAEEAFGRARRLSEAIERQFQDSSLVRFTEAYRGLHSVEAARVLAVMRSLETADAHYDRGDFLSAAREGRAALTQARAIDDVWNELRALEFLGDVTWAQGAPQEAREYWRLLLTLAQQHGSREREAAAVNSLSAIDEDEGNLRAAVDGYRRALELGRRHALPDIEAFALLYLGHLFHHQGLYQRAVGYSTEAEEGFRQIERIELEASAASNRGASLQRMQRVDTALAAYRRSLSLRTRLDDLSGRSATLLNIAELLAERGEDDEALTVLGQILSNTRNETDSEALHVRWGALLTAGDLYLAAGRNDAAKEVFEEAMRLAEQRHRLLDQADTARSVAKLRLAQDDVDGAAEKLETAVEIVEAIRASAPSHQERVHFLETRRAIYEELAGVHFQRADPEAAFDFLERSRSRALLDSLKASPSLSADETGAPEIVLEEAAETETLEGLVASLEPGTLLLHYTVTPDWFAVLAIDSTGLRAWKVRDLPEEELSRLALLFGGDATASFALQEGWTQLYSDAQRSLSVLLLAPVTHLLPDASTLLIVPDDVLFSLPWGALRWGDWTRYLSETHAIAVQPSASTYVRLHRRASPRRLREPALLVANPGPSSLGRTLPLLPEAEREAEELADLMPGSRLLIGSQASEAAVRQLMGQYSVLHFGTHARVDTERPVQSSLLLAGDKGALEESVLAPNAPDDGVLTGMEVLDTPLRPGALVTLAACETVRGPQRRGEGVVGMARAFLQSGATTVIATLWPVEDRAARELMVRFYEKLVLGSAPAAALSQSQAEIAQGGAGERRRYPYFWAGFVLIGDDR